MQSIRSKFPYRIRIVHVNLDLQIPKFEIYSKCTSLVYVYKMQENTSYFSLNYETQTIATKTKKPTQLMRSGHHMQFDMLFLAIYFPWYS